MRVSWTQASSQVISLSQLEQGWILTKSIRLFGNATTRWPTLPKELEQLWIEGAWTHLLPSLPTSHLRVLRWIHTDKPLPNLATKMLKSEMDSFLQKLCLVWKPTMKGSEDGAKNKEATMQLLTSFVRIWSAVPRVMVDWTHALVGFPIFVFQDKDKLLRQEISFCDRTHVYTFPQTKYLFPWKDDINHTECNYVFDVCLASHLSEVVEMLQLLRKRLLIRFRWWGKVTVPSEWLHTDLFHDHHQCGSVYVFRCGVTDESEWGGEPALVDVLLSLFSTVTETTITTSVEMHFIFGYLPEALPSAGYDLEGKRVIASLPRPTFPVQLFYIASYKCM